jgi:hypothetical protein
MPAAETLPFPQGEGITIPQGLDLGAYLDRHDRDPAFRMVEIGHGPAPVTYLQPNGFTGQRSYDRNRSRTA